jgi:two-component system phosphate regulon sensor histidine kinase PhoR
MGLSKQTVWVISVIMVIALAGLIGLQTSLLRGALKLKEQTFQQNVQVAMSEVTRGLETAETITATLRVIDNTRQLVIHTRTMTDSSMKAKQLLRAEGFRLLCDSNGQVVLPPPDSLRELLQGCAAIGTPDTDRAEYVFEYLVDTVDTSTCLVDTAFDSVTMIPLTDSARIGVISKVMERLSSARQIPITERIKPAHLDSLLRQSLAEYGINLEPVYGILVEGDSAVQMVSSQGFDSELRASQFRAGLFPNDVPGKTHELAVYFPDRTGYMWRQIGPMLGATALFMLVVTGVFAYSVKTMVAQRRAGRQMVEFVNNMTHEFKTPISTVALACEAILREDVIATPDKVRRFSQMIVDENRRMRHQVEKILQMAALEETQGRLTLATVDIHEVITNAVDSIALQVERRGGTVTCDLKSTRHNIQADEVHLTGIIYNLLDNANKYSPDSPHIRVSTEDSENGVLIRVADSGVGLRAEDKKRIFDKYYRVFHGNVHDVKGFGLGLSYVALMVRAHGGRIRVESEPGKGTQMILWFPGSLAVSAPNEETLA